MGRLYIHAGLACLSFLLLLSGIAPAASGQVLDNVITDWNYVLQQIIRSNGINSQIASRYFALLHLAQYKSLKQSASVKAAVGNEEFIAASAAHLVLSTNFPVLQSRFLDAILKKYALKAGLSSAKVQQLQKIASLYTRPILANSVFDGTQDWAFFTPAPLNGRKGAYQFTPNQTFAIYPQLASSRPLVVKNKDVKMFDKQGGPLKLGTRAYSTQLAEVKTIGNSNTEASLKATANFWADGSATAAVPGHIFNVSVAVLPKDLSILTTAKVFALQGIASFDASVATWNQKFKYLFWRPITAITQGDSTHPPEPFTPFLATPPHPEYPSGHSATTGSQIGIVARFLGIPVTAARTVTIGTEFPGLPPRTYPSLYALANEVGLSRIYGGIHFRKSVDDGLTVGLKVADYVFDNFDSCW